MKRRRSYFINPPFQSKMLIASFVITLPIISLFYLAYNYFIRLLIERIEMMDQATSMALIGFFSQIEYNMKMIVVMGTVMLLVFNSVFFLLLSHAIAGPIEKLKGHLKKKAENQETGPFTIRASDFFAELPPLVNEAFKDSTISSDSSKQ